MHLLSRPTVFERSQANATFKVVGNVEQPHTQSVWATFAWILPLHFSCMRRQQRNHEGPRSGRARGAYLCSCLPSSRGGFSEPELELFFDFIFNLGNLNFFFSPSLLSTSFTSFSGDAARLASLLEKRFFRVFRAELLDMSAGWGSHSHRWGSGAPAAAAASRCRQNQRSAPMTLVDKWQLLVLPHFACTAAHWAQVWRHAPSDCLWHSFTDDTLFTAPCKKKRMSLIRLLM